MKAQVPAQADQQRKATDNPALEQQGERDSHPATTFQRRMMDVVGGGARVSQHRAREQMIAGSPRLLQQKAAVDGIGSSARVLQHQQATPTQLKSAGAPVMQRQLYADVNKTRGDPERKEVGVDELAFGDAGLTEYARLMKDDSSALVTPPDPVNASARISSVKTLLSEADLDGGALKAKFIPLLMTGDDWKHADAETLTGMKEKAQEAVDADFPGTYDLSKAADWKEVSEEGYVDMTEIVTEQIGDSLNDIAKAGDLAGVAFSAEWKQALAFAAYDLIKGQFYAIVGGGAAAGPPPQPFMSLISDINAGEIEELSYVRKYNSPGAGLGAEFTVEAPDDKKDLYDNKAVIHTHYTAVGQKPNYGHTKPYANRYAGGYGYTIVKLDKINSINDTQKVYNTL